jgi:hypothetical protein
MQTFKEENLSSDLLARTLTLSEYRTRAAELADEYDELAEQHRAARHINEYESCMRAAEGYRAYPLPARIAALLKSDDTASPLGAQIKELARKVNK